MPQSEAEPRPSSNDWEISSVKLNFEDRIEIKGRVSFTYAEQRLLSEQGAFVERINWAERVFIPTGENGSAVFERITASKPVIDLAGKHAVPGAEEIAPELELEYGIPSMVEPSEVGVKEEDKPMSKYTVLALDQRTREDASLGEFDEAKDAYSAFMTAIGTTTARVVDEKDAVLAERERVRLRSFTTRCLRPWMRKSEAGGKRRFRAGRPIMRRSHGK